MTDKMINLKIPADLVITLDLGTDREGQDITENRPFSFYKDFLVRTVLRDPRWGKSSDWIFSGMEIREIFSGKVAGDIVTLSNDQYTKLKDVVREPSQPYMPVIAFAISSYFRAILDPVKEAQN